MNASITPVTASSFLVNVPVLSVQMTSTEPSASTAFRLLTRTFFFARRRPPIANASVKVGSKPSGTLATMMPNMNTTLTQSGRPMAMPQQKKAPPMTIATAVRMRTMRDTSRSSGVGGRGTCTLSAAILPNSVRDPVACTTAMADPRTIVQPANARFVASTIRPCSTRPAPRLAWRDSPVNGALFASRS